MSKLKYKWVSETINSHIFERLKWHTYHVNKITTAATAIGGMLMLATPIALVEVFGMQAFLPMLIAAAVCIFVFVVTITLLMAWQRKDMYEKIYSAQQYADGIIDVTISVAEDQQITPQMVLRK